MDPPPLPDFLRPPTGPRQPEPQPPSTIAMTIPTGPEPPRRAWVPDPDDLPEPVVLPPSTRADSDETKGNNFGAFMDEEDSASGGESKASKYRRKRFIVPLAVLITLLVVGAILGAVLGTVLQSNPSELDDSPRKNGTIVNDTPPHSLHPSSNLAAATTSSSSSNVRLILFQHPDGDLVTIEWRGSSGKASRMSRLTDGNAPQKPLAGTPFQLVNFGSDSDLHLFYIDDTMRLAHIVRRSSSDEGNWDRGSLSTSRGQSKLPAHPMDSLRLSVTVMPEETNGAADGYVIVVYHTGPDADSVVFVSSSDPDDANSWKGQFLSLATVKLDLKMNPESPSLLLLPVARKNRKGDMGPGIQFHWDVASDSGEKTLGAFECSFTQDQTLDGCQGATNDWRDSNAEQRILDAPKPLTLSAISLVSNRDPVGPSDYLIRVLDGGGRLTELRRDDKAWVGYQPFSVDSNSLPQGVSTNFTSVASADEGIMYSISDDKLLEFGREGSWWSNDGNSGKAAWKFLSVINSTVSRDD